MATQKEKYGSNDNKCLHELHGALPLVVYNLFRGCKTEKEFWDTLKEKYQGSEKTKKISMKQCLLELGEFRQKESETIKIYYDCLNGLIFKCNHYGETLSTLEYNLTLFLWDCKRSGGTLA